MDRDTMVSFMQQKLGFRTQLTQACINQLQAEQDDLERGATLPWFLLQEDQTFVITPSVPVSATPQQYNLPPNFIREPDHQDGNLRYQQSVPGPQVWLKKTDYEQAEQFFFNNRLVWWDGSAIIVQDAGVQPTAGVPKAYVLRKTQVRIYPGPDKTYNLLWTYYGHDSALSAANVTNGWSTYAPWLLIGRAGLQVAIDIRDADAVSAFQLILNGTDKKKGAVDSYLALLYEREEAGRTYSMGARL